MPIWAWLALAAFFVTAATFGFITARAYQRRTGSLDKRDPEAVPGFVPACWCIGVAWGVLSFYLLVTGHSWAVVGFWFLASVAAGWFCFVALLNLTRPR